MADQNGTKTTAKLFIFIPFLFISKRILIMPEQHAPTHHIDLCCNMLPVSEITHNQMNFVLLPIVRNMADELRPVLRAYHLHELSIGIHLIFIHPCRCPIFDVYELEIYSICTAKCNCYKLKPLHLSSQSRLQKLSYDCAASKRTQIILRLLRVSQIDQVTFSNLFIQIKHHMQL